MLAWSKILKTIFTPFHSTNLYAKIMKPKRVVPDILQEISLVKNIDTEQISSKPEKYLFCNEDLFWLLNIRLQTVFSFKINT